MKSDADIVKNLDNKGNAKGFNKGKEPETYGQADGRETGGRHDSDPTDYGNIVGGIPNPNEDKNKIYDKKLRTPREPVLNAVPMPNRKKGNVKNYKTTDYIGDGEGDCTAMADVPIGGTPKPNNIR